MRENNLLLIIFVPILLYGDYSWERSHVEPLVIDGIHALYNYKFESAISILDSAWKLDDTHPLIPFVLISAKWLKIQTEEGYDISYAMINNEVANTIPIYKKMIEKYPNAFVIDNPPSYNIEYTTVDVVAKTITYDSSAYDTQKVKDEAQGEINRLEGTVTARRMRDALASDEGNAWVALVEEKIKVERNKL